MQASNMHAAAEYLLGSLPNCLSWVNQEAIHWHEEPTIAFRQELIPILEMQQHRGLPPLGAIAFVMAACRESWENSYGHLVPEVSECIGQMETPEWLSGLFTTLSAINGLPRELLNTTSGKAALCDYFFDDINVVRTSPEVAADVVTLLRVGPFPEEGERADREVYSLWHLLTILNNCLRKFDPAVAERRMRVGLEREITAAEVELPPGERTRQLMRTLADDPELGGIARLARQMLASVSLPRSLADPDELPLGGVSDISNRGQMDRLLVTELANDDLVLAVRVATNEALYLHREQPRSFPPLRRKLLIDSGIRMWGVPRVFATALGMAVAASTEKMLEVETFRASGTSLTPIDLTRKTGLETHFKAIEPDLDLSAALPAFVRRLNSDKTHLDQGILVTSPETLHSPEFMAQLRAAEFTSGWVATVARNGEMKLFQWQRRALVLVRELKFDLDTILKPTVRKQPDVLQQSEYDLPAYCRLKIPPLRVPHSLTIPQAWHVPGLGVLAMHKDRRLTLWDDPRFGPVELHGHTPLGKVHWYDPRPEQQIHHAVIGNLGPRSLFLLTVNVASKEVDLRPLVFDFPEQPTGVCGSSTHVFIQSQRNLSAYTLDGRLIAKTIIPAGYEQIAGRHYWDVSQHILRTITCDDNGLYKLKFEENGSRSDNRGWHAGVRPLKVLSPSGNDEQLALLTTNGDVVELSTGQRRSIIANKQNWKLIAISRDHRRLLTQQLSANYIVDVATGTNTRTFSGPDFLEPEVTRFTPPTVRKNFRAVGISPAGHLIIHSRRGQELAILPQNNAVVIRDQSNPAAGTRQLQRFRPLETSLGYDLAVAEWDGGNRIWLDSRGLLHLRCANPSVPELTLVLVEGQTAGRTSDGEWFGLPYYVGPEARLAKDGAAIVDNIVRQFRVNL